MYCTAAKNCLLLPTLKKERDDFGGKIKARRNAKRKRVDEQSFVENEKQENEEQPCTDAEDEDECKIRHRTVTLGENIKEGLRSIQDSDTKK